METKSRQARDWIVSEWSEKFALTIESMADERPVLAPVDEEADCASPAPDALIWVQSFAVLDKPGVWVAASAATCLDLGRRTLTAAGVVTAEDAECRSTFLEILSQSMSALGTAMGERWECAAEATSGEEVARAANGLKWVQINLQFAGTTLEPIWLAVENAFLDNLIQEVPTSDESSYSQTDLESSAPHAESSMPVGSKIFDLLLDIALPVSVSFGRTLLPIKEVLRLNSGSIVELDRAINEPVEVIVNNCVIARGEVVVIEGNYGVRIQEIASRDDRLRTGTAASQIQRILPAQ
jgi:flagellar motor switch protein FliN/FliY